MAVDFSADTISIPQQGLQNYPIEEINREAPEISFKVALGATVLFTGQRIGRTIQGVFQQSGAQGTFQLTYAGESPPLFAASGGDETSASTETERPFRSEQVILDAGTGVLYGTLTLPDRAGPVPLVLIIAGSGPADRYEPGEASCRRQAGSKTMYHRRHEPRPQGCPAGSAGKSCYIQRPEASTGRRIAGMRRELPGKQPAVNSNPGHPAAASAGTLFRELPEERRSNFANSCPSRTSTLSSCSATFSIDTRLS